MFKLRRFRQERFVQELCCSSFATATASRPYSGLGTSSHALGWDPGSTGRSAAAGCTRAGHSIKGFSASTWVSSKAKLVLVIDNEANSEEQSQ